MIIFTRAWISRITWAHQSMGLAAEVSWRRGSSMSGPSGSCTVIQTSFLVSHMWFGFWLVQSNCSVSGRALVRAFYISSLTLGAIMLGLALPEPKINDTPGQSSHAEMYRMKWKLKHVMEIFYEQSWGFAGFMATGPSPTSFELGICFARSGRCLVWTTYWIALQTNRAEMCVDNGVETYAMFKTILAKPLRWNGRSCRHCVAFSQQVLRDRHFTLLAFCCCCPFNRGCFVGFGELWL